MSIKQPQQHFLRAYLILWVLSILGSIAILPYALTMTGISDLPNIPVVILSNMALYAVLIFVGLKCSAKHFNIFLLYLPKNINWIRFFLLSTSIGGLLGFSIVGLDKLLFSTFVSPEIYQTHIFIPKWQGLMASLYGAVNEEVLLRLGLLGILTWVVTKWTKNVNLAIVLGIVLTTFAFGAGHLPALYQVIDVPTIPDIARVMFLNGIAGLGFGILYWKLGLESAMLAHFIADLILHVMT